MCCVNSQVCPVTSMETSFHLWSSFSQLYNEDLEGHAVISCRTADANHSERETKATPLLESTRDAGLLHQALHKHWGMMAFSAPEKAFLSLRSGLCKAGLNIKHVGHQ